MKVQKVCYNSETFFSDLYRSLVDTGFAVVTGAPVSNELIQAAYDEWKGFFADDRKHAYLFGESQSGYFPIGIEHAKDSNIPDHKEFFHLYPGEKLPQIIPTHYSRILFEVLDGMASELLAGIDAFYGIDGVPVPSRHNTCTEPAVARNVLGLANMVYGSPSTLMRALHYPAFSESEVLNGQLVRSSAHEDINLITLLPVSTAPGLQVRDREGNWHDVGGVEGDIVVNAGDMLQALTGGSIRSTTHRVVTPKGFEGSSRYSMAVFVHAKPETIIADGRTAREFLDERLKAIGIK